MGKLVSLRGVLAFEDSCEVIIGAFAPGTPPGMVSGTLTCWLWSFLEHKNRLESPTFYYAGLAAM